MITEQDLATLRILKKTRTPRTPQDSKNETEPMKTTEISTSQTSVFNSSNNSPRDFLTNRKHWSALQTPSLEETETRPTLLSRLLLTRTCSPTSNESENDE